MQPVRLMKAESRLNQNNRCMFFGDKGELLPAHAVKGFVNLEKLFAEETRKAGSNRN
jgi:hypothetical protein